MNTFCFGLRMAYIRGAKANALFLGHIPAGLKLALNEPDQGSGFFGGKHQAVFHSVWVIETCLHRAVALAPRFVIPHQSRASAPRIYTIAKAKKICQDKSVKHIKTMQNAELGQNVFYRLMKDPRSGQVAGFPSASLQVM